MVSHSEYKERKAKMAKKHWNHKIRLLNKDNGQYVVMTTSQISRAIAGGHGGRICKRISLYCSNVMFKRKTFKEMCPLIQAEVDKMRLKCRKNFVVDSIVSEPYISPTANNVVQDAKTQKHIDRVEVSANSNDQVHITMIIPRSMMKNGKATVTINID